MTIPRWVRIAALTLAGAGLLAAFAIPSASARVQIDPCRPYDGAHYDGGTACQTASQVAGMEAEVIPHGRPLECREDQKLVFTPVTPHGIGFNALTAGWDFWSSNAAWVSWTGDGRFSERDIGDGRKVATGYSPKLHNWYFNAWEVRAFHHCDGYGGKDGGDAGGDPGPTGDYDHAGAGQDTERGGSGLDVIRGGRGDDQLHGGSGGDQLLGGGGEDVSRGGAGSDELFDDHGVDSLSGGPGNDRFSASDGDADTIECGGGEDIVVADTTDLVRGCEHVYTSAAEAPAVPPAN